MTLPEMAVSGRPVPDCHGHHPRAAQTQAHPPAAGLAALYQKQLAPFLCAECIGDFTPIVSPLCLYCGTPFKSGSQPDHHCGRCLSDPPRFAKARSAAEFSGSLRACLQALKYNGRVALAEPLAQLLLAAYLLSSPETGNRGDDVVVPVPLGQNRLRARGFNQVYLLVHKWQQMGRREAVQVPTPLADGLIKVRRTQPQTGLNREMRLKNVSKAFKVNGNVNLKGRKVLLVDDVYTTGATLAACTEALLAGGAARVNVLTHARRI